MNRRKTFTQAEVEQIKKLITEKLHATPDQQKRIRAEIRKIGFHFSDFSHKKDGYDVGDFEAILRSGAIKEIEDNVQPIFSAKTSKGIGKQVAKNTKNDILIQHSKKSFEPLIDEETEILILGTMPGERSLAAGEYYNHSGNRFWKIIAKITNGKVPTSYEEKKKLLIKQKIGLWDIAKVADREGSLDANMFNEIPNDLDKLLNDHPKIRVIGLNGGKAVNLFDKHFNKRPYIVYYNLSSTSGANTSITLEMSCNQWRKILR
jgi:hypoxanthine-DNA glycosylase